MISIYSDPHLGQILASHTTADSRKRLRDFMQGNVNRIVDSFDDSSFKICAGDFFHTYQNTEEVLYAGMWAASRTDKILAGNHDVVNIADRKGTLDILEAMFDTQVVPCKFGEVNYQTVVESPLGDGLVAVLIPHHSTQELFEEALNRAKESACLSTWEEPQPKQILIAHCNYDSPFVKDDVMLNMTSRMASKLLEVFDYVVLGHDHRHRTDHDDRLIVVGSPHPTNFGDVCDKFVLHFDEDMTPSLEQVWDEGKHFLECNYADLDSRITDDHQWVLLTGEIPPSEIHALASTVRKAWKKYKPFAIKSDVKILTGDSKASAFQATSPDKLNELILKELESSPEMYNLWKELSDD